MAHVNAIAQKAVDLKAPGPDSQECEIKSSITTLIYLVLRLTKTISVVASPI